MQPHWGYATRILPCTNDKGSCEYLDAVYWMHDVSMIYTAILWAVLLSILAVWLTLRGWRMGGPSERVGGVIDWACDGVQRAKRRWLLVDAPLKSVFGRVTRLQVAVLAAMLIYLIIFSLVSVVYRTWITPVKKMPGVYNTRTGLGGFSDRIGALAYALTPFAVLLSQRESILSMITAIPYQHFNFLHRWLGRIIFVQSFLHTLAWTLIEGRFYQPQPTVYKEWIQQQYMVFGCVAMLFITFLTVFSTQRAIRWTGYEFFKITHWIVAILYLVACWGHWQQLACWMIPSIALIFIDQGVRCLRIATLHFRGGKGSSIGFRNAEAELSVIGEGDDVVVRMDFDFKHREAWLPGQHFYLTHPGLSIWQAHPYTPASSPDARNNVQHHTYLLRVRRGQTSMLAALASSSATLSTILTGPYGKGYPSHDTQNVLAVAGGTGVTFTLPIAIAALRQLIVPQAVVDFVWVIRRAQDLLWLPTEMVDLKAMLKESPGLRISIFVTRESSAHLAPCCNKPLKTTVTSQEKEAGSSVISSSSEISSQSMLQELLALNQERFNVNFLGNSHPSMKEIVKSFIERAATRGGDMQILGSGPEAMGSDLRAAVAKIEESEGCDFYWDSRE
jgi:NAD(P)H-flavin reductase